MAQSTPTSSELVQSLLDHPGSHRAAVGVVIPAYNEEPVIAACLNSLRPFQEAGDPILVVNAASTDRTADIARQAGVWVFQAASTSRGLAVETGVRELMVLEIPLEAVLIVHADMELSPPVRPLLIQALRAHPEAPGGSLGHRIAAPGAVYRLIEWGNWCRARFLQIPYGDQAQFFRPSALPALGGFPRQECLEDLELSLRMRKIGPLIYLNLPVRISARHWQRGIVSATVRNWGTVLRYLARRRFLAQNYPNPVIHTAGEAGKSTEIDPRPG
ncbi:MAG TPA: glycosyltransferase [bacterium]|nr:glycosyltransferase [bacterium]